MIPRAENPKACNKRVVFNGPKYLNFKIDKTSMSLKQMSAKNYLVKGF